ncbi:MAG: hypothetical protein IT380_27660 [Myxococcales bacterium]|nr:hypothetical protein [Myxococcales bacterium]
MIRFVASLAVVALLTACPKRTTVQDAGTEEDAGVDAGVDAGWPRGDDPPTGWSVIEELPTGATLKTRLGVSVSSAPDQHGHPLVAYLEDDPNGDDFRQDTRLFFTRWNGSVPEWTSPKQIEVVGEVDVAHPLRQVSVARDSSTGRIGIAYVRFTDNVIRYAWSDDDGANFSLQSVSPVGGAAAVSNPSLVMHGGLTELAYVQGSELVLRRRASDGASWTEEKAPGAMALQDPVSVAVDSDGLPAVAFFQDRLGGLAELVYWRPGAGSVNPIATSGAVDVSQPGRRPSVTLVFVGKVPHVAFHLRNVEPAAMNDQSPELFYAKGTDGLGVTWSTPVAMPRNGNGVTFHSTRYYQALTAEASGRTRVAGNFAANGALIMCGGPKLAKSDDGVTFTTCAPTGSPVQFGGEWLSMWQHAPGKLTLIFHYDNRANANLKPGVVMWREP